jgi:tetratricopeptide (TPR) repeat protein
VAAPFLAVAVVLSGLTVWAYTRYGQLHTAHPFIPAVGGLMSRMALAGVAVSFYFLRFFWPWQPMAMYPQGTVDPPAWIDFLPLLAWAALLAWCWAKRKSWGRHALLGLGFFLLMIAPFSGWVTQSYMYFTWVMDHFLYIPMIGLVGLTVAALEKMGDRLPRQVRPVGLGVLSLAIMLLAAQSRIYAAAWIDGQHLWSDTVEKNRGAWLAHYNLGNDLRAEGRLDEAITEYRTAILIHPQFDWSHNNLGICLMADPDCLSESEDEFREALRLRPDFPEAHTNLANVLAEIGNLAAALAEYRAALADQPDFVEARYDLALALANSGRTAEAANQLRELLRRKPGYAPAKALLEKLPAP